jgi:hypothetical protein
LLDAPAWSRHLYKAVAWFFDSSTPAQPVAAAGPAQQPIRPSQPQATLSPQQQISIPAAPVITPAPAAPAAVPTSRDVARGDTWRPQPGLSGVCSGDFSVLQPTGRNTSLYDNNEATGLVIGIEADSSATVVADNPGHCAETDAAGYEVLIRRKDQETKDHGCNDRKGCQTVKVVRLDRTGVPR